MPDGYLVIRSVGRICQKLRNFFQFFRIELSEIVEGLLWTFGKVAVLKICSMRAR